MNAAPARKNSFWVTRTAAARLRTSPTREIVFGVSRDSINRSRASAVNTSARRAWGVRRRPLGGASIDIRGRAVEGYAVASPGASRALDGHAQLGRTRLSIRSAVSAARQAAAAPAAASNQ